MSPTATFNVTPPLGDPLPPVREEVPVLIIGAGPTGLLGAVLLTKLGGMQLRTWVFFFICF